MGIFDRFKKEKSKKTYYESETVEDRLITHLKKYPLLRIHSWLEDADNESLDQDGLTMDRKNKHAFLICITVIFHPSVTNIPFDFFKSYADYYHDGYELDTEILQKFGKDHSIILGITKQLSDFNKEMFLRELLYFLYLEKVINNGELDYDKMESIYNILHYSQDDLTSELVEYTELYLSIFESKLKMLQKVSNFGKSADNMTKHAMLVLLIQLVEAGEVNAKVFQDVRKIHELLDCDHENFYKNKLPEEEEAISIISNLNEDQKYVFETLIKIVILSNLKFNLDHRAIVKKFIDKCNLSGLHDNQPLHDYFESFCG